MTTPLPEAIPVSLIEEAVQRALDSSTPILESEFRLLQESPNMQKLLKALVPAVFAGMGDGVIGCAILTGYNLRRLVEEHAAFERLLALPGELEKLTPAPVTE